MDPILPGAYIIYISGYNTKPIIIGLYRFYILVKGCILFKVIYEYCYYLRLCHGDPGVNSGGTVH